MYGEMPYLYLFMMCEAPGKEAFSGYMTDYFQ